MAVSRHADTPAKDEPVTAGSATPYTTPVDVNETRWHVNKDIIQWLEDL